MKPHLRTLLEVLHLYQATDALLRHVTHTAKHVTATVAEADKTRMFDSPANKLWVMVVSVIH